MPIPKKPVEDFIDFKSSYKELSNLLITNSIPIELTNFDRFVQEIGCKSYPNYKFDAWHIRKISQWCDEVMSSERKLGIAALPRGHLKSTLLGYLFSIYRFLTGFGDSYYVSYKEELSMYHMSNIKTAINNNPILNKFCKDLVPSSNSQIHYKIGNKIIRMFGNGIFSFKRGPHCDGVVIVDDILGTVENPMILTELEHAENAFNSEIVPIPNKGCPMLVFGTVMDYSDLLFKLRDNPQYMNLWLPALNPDSEHEVLWDRYDKLELEKRKEQQGWKAFSTEYLLIPVLATNAFFSREDLDKIINTTLINYTIGRSNGDEWWRPFPIIAGYDIGKKRNPSHISVFAVVDTKRDDVIKQKLVMIHQKFFDNWDYTKQIEYIYQVMDFFNIQRMYYDNTRSEFDERNLPRGCSPIILGARTGQAAKGKMELAINFSKLVEQNKIELLNDDRYIAQILSVTNDLQVPSTAGSHGDSFISTMLAIGVFTDYYELNRKSGFSYLGDLQTIMQGQEAVKSQPKDNKTGMVPFDKEAMKYICKICNSKVFDISFEGKKKCVRCGTTWFD